MRLHWVNALGLSLHPKTLKFRMMDGLFFAFAVIVLLANLAGGYVESVSHEKVEK